MKRYIIGLITLLLIVGCGMTSAILSFYNLQFFDGINYNWKVIIVAPLMISILLKRLLRISLQYFDGINFCLVKST